MYTLESKLVMGTFMSSRTLVLLPPGTGYQRPRRRRIGRVIMRRSPDRNVIVVST